MDEEIKDVETAQEEASSSEESQNTVDSVDTAVEPEATEETAANEDFYKAELEKRVKQAEYTIEKERQKAKLTKGMTAEEVEKIVERKTAEIEHRLQEESINTLASRYAGSKEEAELNLVYFKGLDPSLGTLDERMRMANAISNRSRNESRIKELERTALSKNTRQNGSGAGSVKETPKINKPTQDDIDAAKFAGKSIEEFMKFKEDRQRN